MISVTERSLGRAFKRAYGRIKRDAEAVTASSSAGFVLNGKVGDRRGVQVMVKVLRYSDARLRENPASGGIWGGVEAAS